MKKEQSIIWHRLDISGHEFARISSNQSGWDIDGTAIFVYQSKFCKLDYSIKCNNEWQTVSAQVKGFVGERIIETEISVDQENFWKLNDTEVPEVKGCIDVDLNFSPVTNLLPIRRLNLAVGEKSTVRAAWLRFPSFQLELLEQTYERIADRIYHYESAGGRFKTDIEVDNFGLAVNYPNFWQIETEKAVK